MAEIHLNQDNFREYTETSSDGVPFLVLGKPLPAGRQNQRRALTSRRRKIRRQVKGARPEVWGTLGMDNVAGLNWNGVLHFSAEGTERSEPESSMPVTCEQIKLIREMHPEASVGNLRVRERYISFEKVSFEHLPDDLSEANMPRIRLTLMLQPDEGALVYYQLYPNQKTINSASAREQVDIEYLQPRPTPGNRCDERDRLDYSVPVLTPHPIEEAADGSQQRSPSTIHERFVIKILTFKRDNTDSASLLRKLHYHIWGHTHELLRWNPLNGEFAVIDGSSLRADARTLFLIHGTASSTNIAFEGLLDGGTQSWLSRLHVSKGGPYAQIIGFNHPTFSEDARMNAEALLDRLPRGFEFEAGMDIVTHSRGGLLGKYLALNVSPLHIQRGVLVACANGVSYFTAGARLAKFLSVLRGSTTALPALKWIMALVQHSGEFLMKQPGALLMTPGSAPLQEVLRSPSASRIPVFLPVVGAFSKELIAQQRFCRRWAERGLDLVIKGMLGPQNDWVVGSREQYIVAPECYPKGWKANELKKNRIHPCRHSGYFVSENAKVPNPARDRIDTFLRKSQVW